MRRDKALRGARLLVFSCHLFFPRPAHKLRHTRPVTVNDAITSGEERKGHTFPLFSSLRLSSSVPTGGVSVASFSTRHLCARVKKKKRTPQSLSTSDHGAERPTTIAPAQRAVLVCHPSSASDAPRHCASQSHELRLLLCIPPRSAHLWIAICMPAHPPTRSLPRCTARMHAWPEIHLPLCPPPHPLPRASRHRPSPRHPQDGRDGQAGARGLCGKRGQGQQPGARRPAAPPGSRQARRCGKALGAALCSWVGRGGGIACCGDKGCDWPEKMRVPGSLTSSIGHCMACHRECRV